MADALTTTASDAFKDAFVGFEMYQAAREETEEEEAVDAVEGLKLAFEGKEVKEYRHGDSFVSRVCNWFAAVGKFVVNKVTCGKVFEGAGENPGMFWAKRDVTNLTVKMADSQDQEFDVETVLTVAFRALKIEKFDQAPEAEEGAQEAPKSLLETQVAALTKEIDAAVKKLEKHEDSDKETRVGPLLNPTITLRKEGKGDEAKLVSADITFTLTADKEGKAVKAHTFTVKA